MSPPASLSFKGQATKQGTVKWCIAIVWHMRKVIVVVRLVIGALRAVSVNFKKQLKQIGLKLSLEVIQKTALLGTAKILRKVLSL